MTGICHLPMRTETFSVREFDPALKPRYTMGIPARDPCSRVTVRDAGKAKDEFRSLFIKIFGMIA